MVDPSEAGMGALVTNLQSVLTDELKTAQALLALIQTTRAAIAQSPSIPDLSNGLPHQHEIERLQALAVARRGLEAALAAVPLPPELLDLTDEIEQVAAKLLLENQGLGHALQVKLLFFNRLLRQVGEHSSSAGVYARDGIMQTTVPARKLDTI
jgi:hypothetical protein